MNEIAMIDWEAIPTKRALLRKIDSLPIAAEGKLALNRITDLTANVGERVVEIGRRIVAFAFELMRQFPALSFMVLVALVTNALLVSIPFLGPLLQPLYGPLVMVAGVGLGALAELREGPMRPRIDWLIAEFGLIFE